MSTEIYRIEGPWRGTLGISAHPRGGDWLEDEIKSWRGAGFDVIVSLLTPAEIEEMDLSGEAITPARRNWSLSHFPSRIAVFHNPVSRA